MLNLMSGLLVEKSARIVQLGSDIAFGTASWYIYAAICCVLVLFFGIMSGLTLGLMSTSLVDLEILRQSGSPTEKKQAGEISIIRNASISLDFS